MFLKHFLLNFQTSNPSKNIFLVLLNSFIKFFAGQKPRQSNLKVKNRNKNETIQRAIDDVRQERNWNNCELCQMPKDLSDLDFL